MDCIKLKKNRKKLYQKSVDKKKRYY